MQPNWGMVALAPAYETSSSLPRRAGFANAGVVFLPPKAVDATFEAGVWQALNDEFGTLFDLAEEEYVADRAILVVLQSRLALLSGAAEEVETRRALTDAASLLAEAVAWGQEVVVSL
jgi:hypothetical protein